MVVVVVRVILVHREIKSRREILNINNDETRQLCRLEMERIRGVCLSDAAVA